MKKKTLYSVFFILFFPIGTAFDRVIQFFVDANKLVRFDFSVDSVTACVDWAIFIDILFSMSFLLPCLSLVLANRNSKSRKVFLNVAMWIHDHNRGPYLAISELLTLFTRIFPGKFSLSCTMSC